MISDHDAPYACLNVRVNRFVPQHKYIRHGKNFDENAFTKDFAELPLSVIYSSDDPDEQLEMLSKLFGECIDRHAPLKRTRVSRPPAPWLKELNVKQFQRDCQLLRTRTRTDKSLSTWAAYREKRNALKTNIKKTKLSIEKPSHPKNQNKFGNSYIGYCTPAHSHSQRTGRVECFFRVYSNWSRSSIH